MTEGGNCAECLVEGFLEPGRFQMVVTEAETVLGDYVAGERRVSKAHVRWLARLHMFDQSTAQRLDFLLDERRIGHDGSAREP